MNYFRSLKTVHLPCYHLRCQLIGKVANAQTGLSSPTFQISSLLHSRHFNRAASRPCVGLKQFKLDSENGMSKMLVYAVCGVSVASIGYFAVSGDGAECLEADGSSAASASRQSEKWASKQIYVKSGAEKREADIGFDPESIVGGSRDALLKKEPETGATTLSVDLTDQFKVDFEDMIKAAQDRICEAMSEIDGTPFLHDDWVRPSGGGGRTRVLQNGKVFEKAGVNVSVVHGKLPPRAVQMMKAEHKGLSSLFTASTDGQIQSLPFYACGLSLVIHPHNPMAPTIHLNYRFFEVVNPETGAKSWWFGGGSDLTPSYLFEEDTVLFHQTLKDVCDQTDPAFYPAFKKQCDDYFVIKHRNERRGVGGIFFDDLDHLSSVPGNSEQETKEKLMNFQKECLDGFITCYTEIMKKRKDLPYTEEQKRWQQLRRGRYVEFNLVYDRGTKFGLYTPNARIESILMSLPLTCRFEYMHKPEEGSDEAKMTEVLVHPKDWLPTEPKEVNRLADLSVDDILEELLRRGVARREH